MIDHESNPEFEDEGKTPCRECGELCEKDYCSEKCWHDSFY